MARRVRGGDGLTERDRFWLRHLERQAAGTETSKAYAAREGLSIFALYQARKHLVARGAWPTAPGPRGRRRPVASPTLAPQFTRFALAVPSVSPAPACRLRLASGVVIEWSAAPEAAQLAALALRLAR